MACLLLLAGPATAAAQDLVAGSLHDCTDHVCFCPVRARGTSPRGSSSSHCDGGRDTGARMSPSCRHGDGEPQLAAVTAGLLPEIESRVVPMISGSAEMSRVTRPLPGFGRTDLPPPRSF